LALVGGPWSADDDDLLDAVEFLGGRIVLDATESGERTLPAPLDADRLAADPLEEMIRIYFDAIPDVFRRPNNSMHHWLRRRFAERRVRGILVRRWLWCDLWHAELPRLRAESGLPVLEWDVCGDDGAAKAAAVNRLEAFLEMLRK
jgi:benzoyl-CoA reductase/2-hydroxyglutaryl-CoA dehydratase subunit BcrC/BadD/HgdB